MSHQANNMASEAGFNKRKKRVLVIGGGVAGMVPLLALLI